MIENIKIIYEDENILAVNKPAGLLVHPDGKCTEQTLADWFVARHPESANVGEDMVLQNGDIIKRPGVVHRLDRDTSGVIVLAKNQETFLLLKSQFQKREVRKTYIALVNGRVKESEGKIDLDIGRGPSGKWSTISKTGKKTREALTEYKVEERLVSKDGKEFTLLSLFPRTGRTHQIRVHLKALGNAVVGDDLYGPRRGDGVLSTRLMLHSKSLEIEVEKGRKLKIEADVPDDFASLIARLQKA